MTPRIRRLIADYKRVHELFNGKHPNIKIIDMEGSPPEKYILELKIKSIRLEPDGLISTVDIHSTELFLPLDYPRRPPFCRMLTPVFHPNIDHQKICIGDHWAAAKSLDQLLIRIAEMIAYQSYNIKSPLNAKAAAWTAQNINNLPIDSTDFSRWL
jgi:ubiquitin-protein ligase